MYEAYIGSGVLQPPVGANMTGDFGDLEGGDVAHFILRVGGEARAGGRVGQPFEDVELPILARREWRQRPGDEDVAQDAVRRGLGSRRVSPACRPWLGIRRAIAGGLVGRLLEAGGDALAGFGAE